MYDYTIQYMDYFGGWNDCGCGKAETIEEIKAEFKEYCDSDPTQRYRVIYSDGNTTKIFG